jgi:3-hydroxyisobutyrate dehydrogenase-like beta-hydroxyacid dehydrogenase
MAKLGFLGLGIMGAPMARHLIEAGHDVALWSHSPDKAQRLAVRGGIARNTPAEVAQQSDCVFLCVGNTEMSRTVILGEHGLAEGASRGLIVVDCSTISPSASRKIAAELSQRGISFLDAPCTGSKKGAEDGALTFMVGGDAGLFERVRPYLEAMGRLLYHCGGIGMGLQVKLSQNLIIGNLLHAFNESLVLSTKAGVAPELMLEVLNNSAAKSGLVAAKAPAVFRRDFSTNFSVKWLEKDLELMLESAAELNVPVPLTSLSRQLLRAAIAKGYGEGDICGSIRVLEEIAACEVSGLANVDGHSITSGLRNGPHK